MPAGPATDARFMALADNVVEFSHQSARLEVVGLPRTKIGAPFCKAHGLCWACLLGSALAQALQLTLPHGTTQWAGLFPYPPCACFR